MLAWMVGALVLAGAQSVQGPVTSHPTPRVHTDANGWPILPGGVVAQPKKEAKKEARTEAEQPSATKEPAAAEAEVEGDRSTPLDSPLLDVFRNVGSVADWKAMRGVMARIRIHVLDHRGAEIGVREVLHQADVTVPDRDRLVFEDERKVYARDGAGAWVELHGMAWPSLEGEAEEELDLLGLLLRLPWALADSRRWTILPEEQVLVDGEPRIRIRARRRDEDAGDTDLVGPEPNPPGGMQVDLLCDPATMRPLEVRYVRSEGDLPRRLLLRDYRPFGPLALPVRRLLVGPRGALRIELEFVRVDGKLDFSSPGQRALFRPGNANGLPAPGR